MRPNIILLMSDQQRQDSLACYGNRFVSSPNLDRLASESVTFNNCFTPYPVCTPARATMWTGVLPHDHGLNRNVYGSENPIDDELTELYRDRIFFFGVSDALRQISNRKETLFSLLQSAGYRTAYFGKWHLGDDDPGIFDVWEGFNSLGGHWINGIRDGQYKPDVQTDQCIEFLKQRGTSNSPFLLVNGFYPPHDPYTAPTHFYEHYRHRGVPFAGYYAAVSALDACVGRILTALDELDLAQNTIVIYYSDHGETFNYREQGSHKFVCHEEAIRVPFIVRWPGCAKAGQELDCLAGLEDLMPTILDWAGVDKQDYLHGHSLVPWLEGEKPTWRQFYYVQNRTEHEGYDQRCVRTDHWKLILSAGGPNFLYNLVDDPEEELNVYDAPREDRHNRFTHFKPLTNTISNLASLMEQRAVSISDELGRELATRCLHEMAER